MTEFTTEGLVVQAAGDGEPRWIGASRITVLATGEQTGGGFGLLVSEGARGASAPLHVHHNADEAMWIVSGRVRVRCGDDVFELGPGDYAFLPRGVPHTFLRLDEDVVMLGIVTPPGEEHFFREAGAVATGDEPPPIDGERMAQVAAQYGDEFVGPPMTLDD